MLTFRKIYHLEFAVVDIETTGGRPAENDITEIAIVITDGNKIIDRFSTLVYTDRPIPPFVRQLTGINEEMLQDAPSLDEL